MPCLRGTPSIMLLRCALTLLMLVVLGVTANAAEGPADQGEYDFGDSIVVFTLEYEDDLLPAPPWALAEAPSTCQPLFSHWPPA